MNAGNLSETSRALSIPITTVKTWRDRYENDPIVAKYRNLKNEELADRFRVVAAMAIERLHSEIGLVKVDNLMLLAATGTDKQLLLTGQPTAITESTSAKQAESLVRLAKQLNQELTVDQAGVLLADSFKRGGIEPETDSVS